MIIEQTQRWKLLNICLLFVLRTIRMSFPFSETVPKQYWQWHCMLFERANSKIIRLQNMCASMWLWGSRHASTSIVSNLVENVIYTIPTLQRFDIFKMLTVCASATATMTTAQTTNEFAYMCVVIKEWESLSVIAYIYLLEAEPFPGKRLYFGSFLHHSTVFVQSFISDLARKQRESGWKELTTLIVAISALNSAGLQFNTASAVSTPVS